MTVVNSEADNVRALFYKREREHVAATGGARNPRPMKPVLITRDQFQALKMAWDPLTDGPPDDIMEARDGAYHWRHDVPFVVDTRTA